MAHASDSLDGSRDGAEDGSGRDKSGRDDSGRAPSDQGDGTDAQAAAVLESMTLLATLSTAVDVKEAVSARRAGRDPSAQEPTDVAAASLHAQGSNVMDLAMQLVLGRTHLAHAEEEALAAVVRHFDLLMKLRRMERLLNGMHQRLLSLYPDVSEALVEDARQTHDLVQALTTTGNVEAVLPALDEALEAVIGFVVWTRHEVGPHDE